MKKRLLIALFVMMGTIISAQMAAAEYTVTTTGNSGYGPYQTGNGGEFSLLPNDTLSPYIGNYSSKALYSVPSGAFQTFCLEENEYIYPNAIHGATISTAAINGGVSGATNGEDPISVGTAYLYFQFASGILPKYNYEGTVEKRKKSAGKLQEAIWWLEGEPSTVNSFTASHNTFIKYLITSGYNETSAKQNLTNEFPVRALNLSYNGSHAQSQLVLVSSSVTDPPSPVPIPGALWLLGSGLAGFVCLRRRFAK